MSNRVPIRTGITHQSNSTKSTTKNRRVLTSSLNILSPCLAEGARCAILAGMKYRSLLAALAAIPLLACDPPPPNLCAAVTCAIAGTTCDPSDGICRCGATEGDVCREGEECVVATSTCQPPIIAGPGTRWEPGETRSVVLVRYGGSAGAPDPAGDPGEGRG